ncbi:MULTISPECIES: hypothetical protein [Pedobacter]|uniref:hypothetical protein n=1 Tax=Pedobacter TaxID=84567 RepID=UPI001E3CB14E|nr:MULTISPECIES: hypothetical protein [Pedobacter]
MNIRELNGKHGLVKAISALLIFTFSFISFVQITHAHSNNDIEHVGDQKENVSFTEKCSICDYLVHKHGKDILLPPPFSISYVLPDINTQFTGVFVGNYKFTLQGFTNKGPPILA